MTQTTAAARERQADAMHSLPETIEQFEATFAELREMIAALILRVENLEQFVSRDAQSVENSIASFPVLPEADIDELERGEPDVDEAEYRLIFSQRCAVEAAAIRWLEQNRAAINSFNVVGALDALGLLDGVACRKAIRVEGGPPDHV